MSDSNRAGTIFELFIITRLSTGFAGKKSFALKYLNFIICRYSVLVWVCVCVWFPWFPPPEICCSC